MPRCAITVGGCEEDAMHLASVVRRVALVGLLLVGAVFVPLPAGAQTEGTFLSFVSEPGDFIGQGESRTFTPDDANMNANASQDDREVHVSVFPVGGGFWFLDLAAREGEQLLPGIYEGATRSPFQDPSEPGLSFSGDGRGCNTLTGRFEVLEAVYGPSGYIERFHATFEQHCEGAAPALFGEVQIVNPPPPPQLELGLTLNAVNTADRITGAATIGGTLTCSTEAFAVVSGTLTQRANRFVLVSGSFFGLGVPCSPTPATWSAVVTGGAGLPFNPGMARLDVTATALDPNFGTLVGASSIATVRLVRSD